jgi:NitT/TauT family transport system ATP-binding protein
MTLVRIDITAKVYQAQRLTSAAPTLQALHLTLNAHEFVCLVGPSGCGKTTLLNMVAGLDRDFQGSIQMDSALSSESDVPLPHHPVKPANPPRIGYVFQNPRLLPWRTVRQNIDLALPTGTDTDYVNHLFELVGLSEAQQVYPEHLSLGMSRRVALVRAFAANPDLLLMDEPFVSLDPPTARRARELLLKLWQERPHTVLFVTHDLGEAIELADRLIFLSSPPTRVIGDVSLHKPREQRSETTLETWRQRLSTDYPEIRSLL